MNKHWIVRGNDHYATSGEVIDDLKNEIYLLKFDPSQDCLFLQYVGDKFPMPSKVYGVNINIVKRVINTYNNTSGNIGVLFNGIKGTGKTVSSKIICNDIENPVIIINDDFKGVDISGFLNNINQDIIIMIDEYEKIFEEKDARLLSIMDGVLDIGKRRMFLLTTNEATVHSAMISRPSRIRYMKSFGNLEEDIIIQIIDDILVEKSFKNDIIEFCKKMKEVTVDNVIQVTKEVNLYKESPFDFKDIFNVRLVTNIYDARAIEWPGMDHITQKDGFDIFTEQKIPDYIINLLKATLKKENSTVDFWLATRHPEGSDHPGARWDQDENRFKVKQVLSYDPKFHDFVVIGEYDLANEFMDLDEPKVVLVKIKLNKSMMFENSVFTTIKQDKAI